MVRCLIYPLIVSLSREPLTIFLSLVPLILVRDFGASPQDLAWLTFLKTMTPFIGFIGSSFCSAYTSHPALLMAAIGLIARLPFLFLLLLQPTPPIVLLAMTVYFSCMKMTLPFWVETLHVLYQERRFECWSLLQSYGYLMGILLGPFLGWILDQGFLSFTSLLAFLTIFSLLSLFLQVCVIREDLLAKHFVKAKPAPFCLRKLFQLFFVTPSLIRFHIVFFTVGCGVLLLHMAVPLFLAPFKETLPYTKLWTISLWSKAVGGFCISFWGCKFIGKNLFPSLCFIIILALLQLAFLHCLVRSQGRSLVCLILSFLCDGMTVSGSNLIWDLSPTVFSRDATSRRYTQLNLLMVGLRSLVIPLLTKFLLSHNEYAFWIGVIFSLYCVGLILSMIPSCRHSSS
ncbi:hypothetical protein [Candidatus Similichlamydia laticola]|uniref:Major facilitator superfamily (MFS) profile domain-containing protein n=1 Tax=Candidatus Similichlamydia laticola TaxID=2170265 RepID=A0A369KK90_9BACT|nr:hypothetical protein [Candidatus Similichlamydia laticola]RDB31416.1 hypothetical protein HAT2_00479 [Candidatus Similichlamydia laticola]